MTAQLITGPTGDGTTAFLTAYSAFEPYELADYQAALAAALPGVAIRIERMATAALIDRLLSEADAPRADIILGWADTAAQSAGLQGLCAGSGGDGYIRPTGFSTAFVVDPAAMAACGARPPMSWPDLAQPALRGRILVPDPGVSGAGFLAMSTLLQFYGEAAGWELFEAICRNAAAFPPSAWAPAAGVGSGAVAAGVTVRIAAAERRGEAPDLTVVEPADVTGLEAEVHGVLAASRHREAAAGVMEWIASDAAGELFRRYGKTILPSPSASLFMIDSARAAADRAAHVARFRALRQTIQERAA